MATYITLDELITLENRIIAGISAKPPTEPWVVELSNESDNVTPLMLKASLKVYPDQARGTVHQVFFGIDLASDPNYGLMGALKGDRGATLVEIADLAARTLVRKMEKIENEG